MRYLILILAYAALPPATVYGQAEKGVHTNGNQYVLNATVIDKATGSPVPHINATVTIPGLRFQMVPGLSDSEGRLRFLMKGMNVPKQLVLQARDRKDSSVLFSLSDPAVIKYGAPAVLDSFALYDTTVFYGTADQTYDLDAYTRFPTMEEVFREFVYELKQRKIGNGFRLTVLNAPQRLYFDEEPLILLDGVPVYDIAALMQLDPLRIKRIDVVTHRYYYFNSNYAGIISLFSYDGDLAGYKLPVNALVTDYNGKYGK